MDFTPSDRRAAETDSARARERLRVFAAPTVIESEVLQQYAVRVIGRSDEVRQQFYALSVERRIRHPAVVAISKSAREDIFGHR